jgi:hypothetical protein
MIKNVEEKIETNYILRYRCPYCNKKGAKFSTFIPDEECIDLKCDCGKEIHLFVVNNELKTFKPQFCPSFFIN